MCQNVSVQFCSVLKYILKNPLVMRFSIISESIQMPSQDAITRCYDNVSSLQVSNMCQENISLTCWPCFFYVLQVNVYKHSQDTKSVKIHKLIYAFLTRLLIYQQSFYFVLNFIYIQLTHIVDTNILFIKIIKQLISPLQK